MPWRAEKVSGGPALLLGLTRFPEVTVSKDVPGFISNALLMPFINEVRLFTGLKEQSAHISQAIMCLEKVWASPRALIFSYTGIQGIGTRDDIDKTLKLGMNHPMGPLQLGECCLPY